MAETVHAPADTSATTNSAVVALLESTLDLVGRIQVAAARDVKSFPEASACFWECLTGTLATLKVCPYAVDFQEDIERLQKILEKEEIFLNKLEEKKHNNGLNNTQQRLKDIHEVLREHSINLCLRLNVELPLDDQEEGSDCTLFPPMLHQVVDINFLHTEAVGSEDETTSDDGDETASTACLSQEEELSDNEGDDFMDPDYEPWDFSRAPSSTSNTRFGSLSNSCSSRKARQVYYSNIQALRALDQTTPITQLRVCLANLDPGDTTPAMLVGRTLMTSVAAPVYGLTAGVAFGAKALLTGRNCLGQPSEGVLRDAKFGASSAFQFAKNVFSHFLLEFDLEKEESNGTNTTVTGTLERCVDDVHLYQGESSRANKKCVFYVNCSSSNSSLPQPRLRLVDLILYRNETRQLVYGVKGNNCKDFVWEFLLRMFQMDAPPNYSFSSSCQTIYGSNWPPCDLSETMALLQQQQQQRQQEQSKSRKAVEVKDKKEYADESRRKDTPAQNNGMISKLQRKRVQIWASSFGKEGENR